MSGFAKVFWGLLLVFLDFRINGFDIIPDLIGFILVYTGLAGLAEVQPRFGQAKKVAVPLLVLSVAELIPGQLQFTLSGPSGWLGFLIAIVVTALNLLLIFNICRGIGELASQEGNDNLTHKSNSRWQYYLWISVAVLVLFPFSMVAPDVAAIFAIPVIVLGLISYLLILLLIREADRTLHVSIEG